MMNGAGGGNRTRVCSLEGCRSTIELRPLLRFGAASPLGLATPESYRVRLPCQFAALYPPAR